MHDAVGVGVNAGALEIGADQLTRPIGFLEVADQFGKRLQALVVAGIDAECCVPVIVRRGRTLSGTEARFARIHDEPEPEQCDNGDDDRKDGAALKAHLLAFALLSELGDFTGRR